MFHWSMGAAGLVAIAAIGVVDYKQKAEASGATLSTFSVSGYMDALGRQSDTAEAKRAEKEAIAELTARQSAGTLMYLPQAPEGWARRAWSAGDNTAIAPPPREISAQEQEMRAALAGSSVAGLFAGDEKTDTSKDKHSWVYARDTDLVAVSARLAQPARTDTMSGMAMSMLSANMGGFVQQNGFAVVQGVAFAENSADILSEKKATYRSFEAFIGMGQEVHLRVRAALDTPDDAIFEILNAIDYTGLNALLAQPLAGVGPHAPELDSETQVALADLAFDIRKKIKDRDNREVNEKMRNLDPLAIAVKQLTSGGATTENARNVNAKALEYQRELDVMLKEAQTKQAAMAADAQPDDTAKAETAGWGSKIADLAKSAGFSNRETSSSDGTQKAASKEKIATFTCSIEGERKRCIKDKE